MAQPPSAPHSKKTDVLIVGAGPTGLILAGLLHRQNISIRLIDQNSAPALESRALGIQAKTLEIFRALGLDRKFLDAGVKTRGVELYLRGEKKLSIDVSDMARPDTPYPYLFMLPQSKTEALLIEDLTKRGVEIERETKLDSFTQNPSGIRAEISTGSIVETISASYIIGCDGAHSAVRRLLELNFNGDAYENEFIMADARVDWPLDQDKLRVFLDPGRIGVFFPHQRSGISRVLTVRRFIRDEKKSKTAKSKAETEATTALPATLSEVQDGFSQVTHLDVKLTSPEWVTRYSVHHRSVDRMRVNRAFLAGDAAHIHSPVGAQGMNTGIQDAANLAWKLGAVIREEIRPEVRETLLDTYHNERWPIGQKLLRFTDRLFVIANTGNPFVQGVRDLILPLFTRALMHYPSGKRYLFRFISQLAIHYHPSAAVYERLSPNAGPVFRKTLPTGSRAPNARVNEKLELFDLIGGYQFHLLILSRRGVSRTDVERIKKAWSQSKRFPKVPHEQHWITLEKSSAPRILKAATKEVFDRFGVIDQGVFLIRPDGYVGFRADSIEQAFKRLRVEEPLKKSNGPSRDVAYP